MDEQTMPEQHLSEELLQQVTGGCKECNKDYKATISHYISYGLHKSHAALAKSNNNDELYDFHNKNATLHDNKFFEAADRFTQRAMTPGHVELPDDPAHDPVRQLFPGRRWIMS